MMNDDLPCGAEPLRLGHVGHLGLVVAPLAAAAPGGAAPSEALRGQGAEGSAERPASGAGGAPETSGKSMKIDENRRKSTKIDDFTARNRGFHPFYSIFMRCLCDVLKENRRNTMDLRGSRWES